MHLLELHDDSFFDPHGRLAGSYTATDLTPDKFPYWDDEFGQSGKDKEPQVLPRCCLCCFKFEPCDSIVVRMYPCQIICPNPLLTRDSQPQKSSLARSLGG